ncbi:MAG: hypothetical protein AB7W59_01920 [Acidimicrobiia bacterium]
MTTTDRDATGRFTRTLEGAERDREACRLRARRATYQQISDQLGYGGASNAQRAVRRTLAAIPRDAADELVALELDQLDMMTAAVLEVLEANHYVVSQGRLIYLGDDPQPLADDAPVLAAVDRLLKIQERRARLLGLDQPTRSTVTHAAADVDAAVAELARELALRDTPPAQ